ncbi:MAG TPA: ThuA domain-containing protein [Armatimonadota bacterium]|nr:ThuA domain-containing protein [Armatimonadota bacterium]HQK93093.1 ThuA domain-containing protein [Armatimonadota bacterium]
MRVLVLCGVLGLAAVTGPSPAADEATVVERIRAVLWVGGFAHDFDAIAEITREFLPRQAPIDISVVHDGGFLDEAELPDLIIMNHCIESTEGILTEARQKRLLDAIRGGVGVVAIHASYYSFTKWPEFRELFGATFMQHAESDIQIEVRVVDAKHPVAAGIPTTFEVHSELYESTPLADDCRLIAVAKQVGGDKEWPSVWAKPYGKGRVVTLLPAHWPDAYRVDAFQRLIVNACLYAAGRGAAAEAAEEAK